jgi:omega-amidase
MRTVLLYMMKVSIIQMEIEEGNKSKNIEKACSLLERCEPSDFVVLPELWSTGLALQNAKELAESLRGETISRLEEYAAQYNQYIIGSILERDNNIFYNTLHVVGPEGLSGSYRKIHLFSLMKEDYFLNPGATFQVISTRFCTIAGIVCYDIRFPELPRALALEGAQILFVPAEFPHPRKNHWKTLLRARAIENQFFVVACNRTGQSETYQFFGASTVIDPWGEILVEAADEENILSCDINLEKISECRRNLPAFHDIQLI